MGGTSATLSKYFVAAFYLPQTGALAINVLALRDRMSLQTRNRVARAIGVHYYCTLRDGLPGDCGCIFGRSCQREGWLIAKVYHGRRRRRTRRRKKRGKESRKLSIYSAVAGEKGTAGRSTPRGGRCRVFSPRSAIHTG